MHVQAPLLQVWPDGQVTPAQASLVLPPVVLAPAVLLLPALGFALPATLFEPPDVVAPEAAPPLGAFAPPFDTELPALDVAVPATAEPP